MNIRMPIISQTALAALAFVGGLTFNDIGPTSNGVLMPQAQARFGRPFTPMSFAGAARRTTRRAFYGGAAAAGSYYGAPIAGPQCYQAVDAWGRIYMRC